MTNHKLAGSEFAHGIVYDKLDELSEAKLSAAQPRKGQAGAFNEFYKLLTGDDFPKKEKVTVEQLLSYSSDIGKEYTDAFKQSPRIISAAYAQIHDTNRQKSWNMVAIYNSDVARYPLAYRDFLDGFSAVSLDPHQKNHIFLTQAQGMGLATMSRKARGTLLGLTGSTGIVTGNCCIIF